MSWSLSLIQQVQHSWIPPPTPTPPLKPRATSIPTNWATSKTPVKLLPPAVLRILSRDSVVWGTLTLETPGDSETLVPHLPEYRTLQDKGPSYRSFLRTVSKCDAAVQGLVSCNLIAIYRTFFVFCETLVEVPFLPLVALMGLHDVLQPHILRHLLTRSVRSPSPSAFVEKRFRSSIFCLLPRWNRLNPSTKQNSCSITDCTRTCPSNVIQEWLPGVCGQRTAPKEAIRDLWRCRRKKPDVTANVLQCLSDSWRWKFNVPSERRLTATEKHGVISRKT